MCQYFVYRSARDGHGTGRAASIFAEGLAVEGPTRLTRLIRLIISSTQPQAGTSILGTGPSRSLPQGPNAAGE
jgi:hypothetical protein